MGRGYAIILWVVHMGVNALCEILKCLEDADAIMFIYVFFILWFAFC